MNSFGQDIEAVAQRCSVKKVFSEVWQNSQKNTCARVSFLIKMQAPPVALLKNRLWHRCFPVSFVKFLRTPFYTEHLWWLLLKIWLRISGIQKSTIKNDVFLWSKSLLKPLRDFRVHQTVITARIWQCKIFRRQQFLNIPGHMIAFYLSTLWHFYTVYPLLKPKITENTESFLEKGW